MTESSIKNVTRGEQMLALRKRREAAAPPFLRGGFRPFFFGAASWAIIAIALWLCTLAGEVSLPTAFEAVAWHRHEMLFGFVGAAVSRISADRNSELDRATADRGDAAARRCSACGRRRDWQFCFSALHRICGLPRSLDVGLFVSLAVLAAPRSAREQESQCADRRHCVLLFGFADAADYAGACRHRFPRTSAGEAPIALIIILISLIGGRIIPSFTRNWMAKQRNEARAADAAGKASTCW